MSTDQLQNHASAGKSKHKFTVFKQSKIEKHNPSVRWSKSNWPDHRSSAHRIYPAQSNSSAKFMTTKLSLCHLHLITSSCVLARVLGHTAYDGTHSTTFIDTCIFTSSVSAITGRHLAPVHLILFQI